MLCAKHVKRGPVSIPSCLSWKQVFQVSKSQTEKPEGRVGTHPVPWPLRLSTVSRHISYIHEAQGYAECSLLFKSLNHHIQLQVPLGRFQTVCFVVLFPSPHSMLSPCDPSPRFFSSSVSSVLFCPLSILPYYLIVPYLGIHSRCFDPPPDSHPIPYTRMHIS